MTRLVNSPDYYGLSINRQYYVEISDDVVAECEAGKRRSCKNVIPVFDYTVRPSCLGAILHNDRTIMKDLCDISFLPQPKHRESVYSLSQGYVAVLSFDGKYELKCQSSFDQNRECKTGICIIKVPCDCSVASQKGWMISPPLINCADVNSRNNIETREFENEHMLLHFFEDNTRYNESSEEFRKFGDHLSE